MTIPTKTALGHEELRSRTQRLGQRHRTILFLIDGRRSLAEVLSLAQQAGSATSHFEDLVRLGLVELPVEPPPIPAEPAVEAVDAADVPEVTSVELDVPAVVAAALEPPPALDAPPLVSDALDLPPVLTAAVEVSPPMAPPGPVPQPLLLDDAVTPAPKQEDVPAALPETAGKAARDVPRRVLPVLGEEAAVLPAAPAPPAAPSDTDSLQPVRDLLIDALRIDAPLFSARMFMRVRNAQTTTELIDLLWEIQNHLVRRHSQRELVSLQQARELLGLGNTLVADDSTRPPCLDE